MSGLRVNSFFLGDSSGVNFYIVVGAIDKDTGKNTLFTCYFEKKLINIFEFSTFFFPAAKITQVTAVQFVESSQDRLS